MARSFRARPVGWRGESHRHYLASKGISTRRYLARRHPEDRIHDMLQEDNALAEAELRKSLLRSQGIKDPVIDMSRLNKELCEERIAQLRQSDEEKFCLNRAYDVDEPVVRSVPPSIDSFESRAKFKQLADKFRDERPLRAKPISQQNDSESLENIRKDSMDDAEYFSSKRYFAKTTRQSLPNFFLMNQLSGVRRPRLKDASSLRRSGKGDVPSKTRLELLTSSNVVRVKLGKSKDDVLLSITNFDSASDHYVGDVVQSSGSALSLGEKVLFRRKNILELVS